MIHAAARPQMTRSNGQGDLSQTIALLPPLLTEVRHLETDDAGVVLADSPGIIFFLRRRWKGPELPGDRPQN